VLRVLLADDTAMIRTLLRRALEIDTSVQVTGEATNGVEAVAMAARDRPDVILLDLAMPVMDGLQAIPEIRRCSPNTRIVVLSAFDASEMEDRALRAGAMAYLAKGSGPDEILATLREVIGRDIGSPVGAPPVSLPGSSDGAAPMSVEHAYKRKHDLFPLLTHEVGNQLTVIKGYAELLLEGIASLPAETSRQFAEAIVRTAGHMGALIESVSDLHKLDLGTMEVQPIELDLVSLVRETLADMARQLGERSVDIVLPEQLHVFADPLRTRQILTNLVSNAAKFSPPSATVAITVVAADHHVELSVADDGPGIAPERQGELFEKFSRLGATVQGTGIGLYVSRAMARAQGGDLVLDPRATGCRFVLRLPRLLAAKHS
jgi:signal transduction histidine kinase